VTWDVTNKELRKLKARIAKLSDWLKKEIHSAEHGNSGRSAAQDTGRPQLDTLAGIMENRLANPLPPELRGRRGSDKAANHVMEFLNENNISIMPELMEIVRGMYARQDNLRERLNSIERRMDALENHIRQTETYMEHRPLYEQYRSLKPRKQKKFYEVNRAGLTLYEAAERYLKSVLNGHPIPLKAWKEEYKKLSSERGGIYREYSALKDKVKDVETVKYCAEQFIREAAREKQMTVKKPRVNDRAR
jgi:chromosome segregation ATPase